MISKKMQEMVLKSSAIRAMFEDGKKMAAEVGAENVYDFSLGNPNVAPPERVKDSIMEIIFHESPTKVHGYMNNSGFESVRQTIAESINEKFGTSFACKNIVMTVGAAGGLNIILKTLINPGDEVVVFCPFFGEYRSYTSNFDAKLVEISPNTVDFQPNLKEFEERLSPLTKAVIVNTPNNPTGVVYSEETIKQLAAILEKKQQEFGTSIYLISDEPYRELVYDGVKVPYITKYYKNTIVGYSYSKSLSMPGERIGYLAIPDEADDAELIIEGVNCANRIMGFVNAPSLMQLVIATCKDVKIDVSYYDRNREVLYKGLLDCGFECVKPQGAFYLFMKAPIEDEKAFCEKAKEFHLILVPGSSFGCPGYVRLAYCVSFETIENSLPAFKKLADCYK